MTIRAYESSQQPSDHAVCVASPVDVAKAGVPNRRGHLRLSAQDIRWLKAARVKYGPTVQVIDISAGGIQIESNHALERDTTLVFELTSPAGPTLVPARVLRSELVSRETSSYRTACAFKRPLDLPELADRVREGASVKMLEPKSVLNGQIPSTTASRTATTPTTSPTVSAGWQKVIARYQDGRLVRGYTNDFHPSKDKFHLSLNPRAGQTQFVPVAALKALFFVREFTGNASYVEQKVFNDAPNGRKIEVVFTDGEVLVGSTLSYRRDAIGFFVQPADSRSNNLRVFVTSRAVRSVRFP